MVHQITPENCRRPDNEPQRVPSQRTEDQHSAPTTCSPSASQSTQEEGARTENTPPSYFLHQDEDHLFAEAQSVSSIHGDTQRTFLSHDRRRLCEDVGLELRRIGDQSIVTKETGTELRRIADEIFAKCFLTEHEVLDRVSNLNIEGDRERRKRKNS